jgi:TPR repeat protein
LAKKGVAFAQAEEGWKFLYGGNGYPLDLKQAVKFLELASEQKNPKAMRFLGHTLYEGKLVTRDVQRGLSLTHEAADLGNVESRLYLGKLYVLGNGHTRDIPKRSTTTQLPTDINTKLTHKFGQHNILECITSILKVNMARSLKRQCTMGKLYQY